jgi:diadenylate cyclase
VTISSTAQMVLEVTVFAFGIYAVLRFLRRTRGSGVIRGLSLVLLIVLITFTILIETLELKRLGVIFDYFRDFAVIGLIIVFQPEIRRGIVHLGENPIFSPFFKREVKTIQRLLRTVARLSKEQRGALIAIERDASLSTIAESGTYLDAELNSYLIENLFYPGAPLHDGAVILRGDRIVAAGCLLPLSQSQEIDKRLGTRHRAALGIAEETDALAIVVSEETGRISTAFAGRLRHGVTLEELEDAIESALGLSTEPSSRRRKEAEPDGGKND